LQLSIEHATDRPAGVAFSPAKNYTSLEDVKSIYLEARPLSRLADKFTAALAQIAA